MTIESIKDRPINLYADCIPVRGACKSAIYDLTRQEIVRFPSEFLDILEEAQQHSIGAVLSRLEDEASRQSAIEFFCFLIESEFVNCSVDPNKLPVIDVLWDAPCVIQNAIIDIRDQHHDYESIFRQLDTLGCAVVEVRCFSNLHSIDEILDILSLAHHTSIQGVELLLKYDPCCSDESYIEFAEKASMVSRLTIHSAPEEKELVATFGCGEAKDASIAKKIVFVPDQFSSEKHCGVIQAGNISVPTTTLFSENKLYNGCLNKKIAIDADGQIKQCPSMAASFGHHSAISLVDIALDTAFNQVGFINKDEISQCRDCEFRYACTDCRAYLEDPADLFSKPLKCGYDPYEGNWSDWNSSAEKEWGINHYGLRDSCDGHPGV